MSNGRSSAWPLFLLGLFSQTQIRIVAFMDISEFICYILGPFFFIQDLPQLRRHGFGKFLFVWFLCSVGCCISSFCNHSPMPSFLRGIGAPVAVFCLACVFHHFLVRDFKSFKWFFLGNAISGIICIYFFQRGTARAVGGEIVSGAAAAENAIGYSLFWMSQLGTWLVLPIQMRYLKLPKWYGVLVAIFMIGFGFLSAGSRSSLGIIMFTLILLLVGGKTVRKLTFVKKHFLLIFLAMATFVPIASMTYKYCAVHNYLGNAAYEKYMKQTKRGTDVLSLLMGGRGETFIGAFACFDKPLVGRGPWALDTDGICLEWVNKYGDATDYEFALKSRERAQSQGCCPLIPGHSFVITFWLWYGILGLICMLYMGWLYFTTLKNNLGAIPELYGAFAFYLPSILWSWLFSPFGGRTMATFMMVLCLFSQAVLQRKFYIRGNGYEGVGYNVR